MVTLRRGSLNKAQSNDETVSWHKSCGSGGSLLWSDKCDGISIALYYKDGKLEQAVTRGDGEVGEDITRNVVKMKGIVPTIKGLTGFVRGEIVLRKSDHVAHFPTYANPRNAASGIAKRLDGTGSEHLTVLHYQIIRFSGTPIPTKQAQFKILAHLGAALPSWGVVNTLDEFEAIYQRYIDGDREALDYDIDGLVVEFDDAGTMESLGQKNHRPKGAVAYKFGHMEKPTILRSVEWQVGNTGRVTPVAIFDPVPLAGVQVKRASLAGVRQVNHLKLYEGCRILVARRNDVIPRVEANLDLGIKNDI